MDLNLGGKSAVVCGSTQGIGKASALELALLGASVTLIARNESMLKDVIKELKTLSGQNHQYLVADFDSPESLKETVENFAGRQLPETDKRYRHQYNAAAQNPQGGHLESIEGLHACFHQDK